MMYLYMDVESLDVPEAGKNLVANAKFIRILDRYFYVLSRSPRETDDNLLLDLLEAMGVTVPDYVQAVFETDIDGTFPDDDTDALVNRDDNDYDAVIRDLLEVLNS